MLIEDVVVVIEKVRDEESREENSMKVKVHSKTYYPHHNPSWFCEATIVDGKVTELYEETGREGGIIWKPGWDNINGTLHSCLESLRRTFGTKFYDAVVKKAYKEKFKSAEKAEEDYLEFKIDKAEGEVVRAREALIQAKLKLEKLEKKRKIGRF